MPFDSDPNPSTTAPTAIEVNAAIIGGGVSGALTAYHMLRRNPAARALVIDARPSLGKGLAYSTPSLHHLLNVPAGKISALPDEPEHFLNWLRSNHDSTATPDTFAPRAVFGRYIQFILDSIGGVPHRRATVIDCQLHRESALLTLDDGGRMSARRVVIATGNFDPAPLPGVDEAAVRNGTYHHNAWTSDAYADMCTDAQVTLIGTGLTAVDVLLRLRELGHRGTITAVSRHGVFPHRHQPHPTLPAPAIAGDMTATCLAYVRAVRKAIEQGAPWRSVVDSLRATTNELWLALPLDEQRRFRRHLQRRWDVVRHRMAPTIADVIDAERQDGTLLVRNGHLISVKSQQTAAVVTIDTRNGLAQFVTARVINCTGPAMNYRKVDSPLLKSLFAQDAISAGPHGGGLRCDATGAILDADGRASTVLFNVGPGRLGTLLESIAVPELRQQAFDLAAMLNAPM